MSSLHHMMCCGVREYHGVNEDSTGVETVSHLLDEMGTHGDAAFILFTEVISEPPRFGRSQRRAVPSTMKETLAIIEESGIGEVITIRARVNPNSGNTVKPYIWSVNWRAFKQWAERDVRWARLSARRFSGWGIR